MDYTWGEYWSLFAMFFGWGLRNLGFKIWYTLWIGNFRAALFPLQMAGMKFGLPSSNEDG